MTMRRKGGRAFSPCSTPATAGIPVIMVTAKAQDQDLLAGYKYGAEYYVTKPFTARQQRTIRNHGNPVDDGTHRPFVSIEDLATQPYIEREACAAVAENRHSLSRQRRRPRTWPKNRRGSRNRG